MENVMYKILYKWGGGGDEKNLNRLLKIKSSYRNYYE